MCPTLLHSPPHGADFIPEVARQPRSGGGSRRRSGNSGPYCRGTAGLWSGVERVEGSGGLSQLRGHDGGVPRRPRQGRPGGRSPQPGRRDPGGGSTPSPRWSHDAPSADRPGRTTRRPSIARVARRAVRRSPGSHDAPSVDRPGRTTCRRRLAPGDTRETSPPDDRSARARPHARAARFPSGRNTPRARCRAGGIGRPGSPSGTDIARSRESGVQQHPSGPGGAVRGRPAPPVRQQRTITRRAGRTRRALPAERADTPRAPRRAGGTRRALPASGRNRPPSSPSGTDIARSRERGVQLHPSGPGGAVRGRPAPPVRQPRTITRRAGRTRRALPAERADSAAQGRRAGRISPARGARGAGRGAGRGRGTGRTRGARGARGTTTGSAPKDRPRGGVWRAASPGCRSACPSARSCGP